MTIRTLGAILVLPSAFFAAELYQKPPQAVLDVLNAPAPPLLWASPTGTHVIIGEQRRYPPIADVSQPFLGLAGVRVNPNSNSVRTLTSHHSFRIKDLATGREVPVALAPDVRLGAPSWSPDGKHFAVPNATATSHELLVCDAATGKIQRPLTASINNVPTGTFLTWIDARTLLLKTVPAGRGKPPAAPTAPSGPIVQEAKGESGPVRTYQDMLDNPYEESLFDYYATSQLVILDIVTGKATNVGKPGIYTLVSASPDGKHILATRIRRPYSYVHSYLSFPRDIEVWDRTGRTVHTVAKLPLADNIPIEGVQTGPRTVTWFSTEPSTLIWTEALDGGNPRNKVPHRDRILRFRAPFQGEPVEVARMQYRVMRRAAIEGSSRAFVTEFDRERRWERVNLIDIGQPGAAPRELWSRRTADRYNDPGDFVPRTLPSGEQAIRVQDGAVFLEGPGGSPQGDHPFLDRMALDTLKKNRLFQSGANEYESFVAMASADGSRFITRRESPTEPPNYYLRTTDGKATAITTYSDPSPQLRQIKKQLVRYKRPDGVELSFTLYLPPGYKEGTRLPTIVYAYPREFIDTDTASQVVGSAQRFTTLTGITHLFCLLAGYAVLDGATMPVVGDSETANNTYVEQIASSAKAAIDKATQMGVTDPSRVGVIGHSYGAFMTANLLAHTDLFKAGVARSGAYNRTLTPFGFQNERRTYWQAPEIYLKMSPFQYADKINEPLLLIHGQADDNPGTFPVQSERLYQAVRGNGGTVRYVVLPSEAHAYSARESIEHTVWETINWFDKYVKNAKPATPSGGSR